MSRVFRRRRQTPDFRRRRAADRALALLWFRPDPAYKLAGVTGKGAPVEGCGTRMDVHVITEAELSVGTHRSTLDELAT